MQKKKSSPMEEVTDCNRDIFSPWSVLNAGKLSTFLKVCLLNVHNVPGVVWDAGTHINMASKCLFFQGDHLV